MMKYLKYTSILIVIGCLNIFSTPSPNNDSCKHILKAAYQQLTNSDVEEGHEIMATYSMTNTYQNGDQYHDTYVQRVSEDYYVSEGKRMKYYADSKCAVTILLDQKKILITPSNNTDEATQPFDQFWQIVDQHSESIGCKEGKEASTVEITVKMNQTGINQTQVQSARYVVDKEKNEIREMTSFYKTGHTLHKSHYQLLDFKVQPQQEIMPALQRIYDQQSALLPAYKDFKLLDYRK